MILVFLVYNVQYYKLQVDKNWYKSKRTLQQSPLVFSCVFKLVLFTYFTHVICLVFVGCDANDILNLSVYLLLFQSLQY